MTTRQAAPRALALACAMSLACAAGCARRPPPSAQDAAASAACRQRADEVFSKQNRAEVFRSDVFATSSRDAPFASTGLPGNPTRGLSNAFQHSNLVDACLNANTARGAGPGAATVAPSPSAEAPTTSP